MFSAVALPSPIPRMRVGELACEFVEDPMCFGWIKRHGIFQGAFTENYLLRLVSSA
jgi:hypothetical protein